MAQNTLIQVRVEDSLKRDADTLFSDLGLDTPTAIRIFLKQALKWHGLPFEVVQSKPNEETIAAIEEVERMKADPSIGKTYTSVDEMMKELLD